MYATATNLLTWIGAKELAEIATPDDLIQITPTLMRLTIQGDARDAYTQAEQDAADESLVRIEAALGDADRQIDSYLASRYTLPLAAEVITGSILPRICGDIARWLLFDNGVTKEVGERYDRAVVYLKDLQSGDAQLGEESPEVSGTSAGEADFEAGSRVFDDDTLQGFI
ncbi:MAG: DUF1320 domain-containing protein [Magnetococcales bacterium]|nr:DUF1320 domain-containing protein [Magnetococcales bacterium]